MMAEAAFCDVNVRFACTNRVLPLFDREKIRGSKNSVARFLFRSHLYVFTLLQMRQSEL